MAENRMKNMRVLITGGAGFIGSNLAYEIAANNAVIIIDDLSTGSIKNLIELVDRKNVTLITGSILDRRLLDRIFNGVDFVFHLAAIPSVPRSIQDPLTANEVNITGTLNVLIAARNNKVKKVIFASSSSVYDDTPMPKKENLVPNSQSPYALTKLVGEQYCHIFHQVYRLPTICLRYFNVYGPRQNPNSEYTAVVPSFISNVLKNESPIIYGDGYQTRDLTFVQDAVQANIIAAESQITGVINVGTGYRTTINELAKNITKIIGKDLQPIYKKPRVGDIRDSLADITLARSIGYVCRYGLEDGLKETIRRFTNGN